MSEQTEKYKVQLTLSVTVEVPEPSEYTQKLLSLSCFLNDLPREQKEALLNYLGEPAVEEIVFMYEQSNNLKQFGNDLDLTITEVEKIAEDE